MIEKPYRQNESEYTSYDWIENLTTSIELQMLLVSGSYTGNADNNHSCYLAPNKVAVIVYKPPFDTVMNITDNASPMVEYGRIYSILEELHQKADIDDCTEYLIGSLKFFRFFHFNLKYYSMLIV